MILGADAPQPASETSSEAPAGDAAPRLVGDDSPQPARDDATEPQTPSTDPDQQQPLIRWRRERPIPRRGVDESSALSRWAQERRTLAHLAAADAEDESEMERQVRDQLYGPGFRRR
jgi:hypothetical protein